MYTQVELDGDVRIILLGEFRPLRGSSLQNPDVLLDGFYILPVLINLCTLTCALDGMI